MINSEPIRSHEMLDIVDTEGNPTGEVRTKAEIHRLGLPHRDVHVWITDGTNVLQQQRAWDKRIMPGAWDISVGGHVGVGESYLDAAVRETAEELGLSLSPDRFMAAGKLAVSMVMEPGPQQWLHRIVGDNFVVVERGLRLEDLRLQDSEVVDARLYPIDQLETDLTQPKTAERHAPHPYTLWQLGIAAMSQAIKLG